MSSLAENVLIYLYRLWLFHLEYRYPFIPFFSLLTLLFFDLQWYESFITRFFSNFDCHHCLSDFLKFLPLTISFIMLPPVSINVVPDNFAPVLQKGRAVL